MIFNSMRKSLMAAGLGLSCSLLSGCFSAQSQYQPQLVARGELTLRYADGIEVWSGNRIIAQSYEYDGLEQFVRCVPKAKQHASLAKQNGSRANAFSTTGIVLGAVSFGGLTGLYWYDKDPALMAVFLSTGIAMAITGVVFGGISRSVKEAAHGNALDAVNYYNDAVGSLGATCDDLTYPEPAGAEPPATPETAPPAAPAPVPAPAPSPTETLPQPPSPNPPASPPRQI